MKFVKKYFKGVYIGLFLILAPGILCLVLSGLTRLFPSLVHEVNMLQSFTFGLFLSLWPLAILGVLIILLSSVVYLVKTRIKKPSKVSKLKLGLASFGAFLLFYLIYIPTGPDACSRVVTSRQYENCISQVFENKSALQIETWLTSNGYQFNRHVPGSWSQDKAVSAQSKKMAGYDLMLQATRKYPRPNNVPFGTNFNRWVRPVFPAPNIFKVNVQLIEGSPGTKAVEVDWSFSFL